MGTLEYGILNDTARNNNDHLNVIKLILNKLTIAFSMGIVVLYFSSIVQKQLL